MPDAHPSSFSVHESIIALLRVLERRAATEEEQALVAWWRVRCAQVAKEQPAAPVVPLVSAPASASAALSA